MANKKRKITFDEYYGELYSGRWESLKLCLASPVNLEELSPELKKPYLTDPASRMAAEALGVLPGDRVLDLCAAPGGKTLALALALKGEGSLTANERSVDRRHRLIRVLKEHLPDKTLSLVTVTGRDARTWGLFEKNAYDKILLDAPCSSERHILNSPAHLKAWGPSRTKRLAAEAYAMVLSAFMALKPQGTLLYCTCALSPLENDGVIEKIRKKHTSGVITAPPAAPLGDFTAYGRFITPDKHNGYGPMYMCILGKPSVFSQDVQGP